MKRILSYVGITILSYIIGLTMAVAILTVMGIY